MALCATKKITPVEDTEAEDAGESDIDGAPLKECIRDKSMEQETVSFRCIYLKRAMDSGVLERIFCKSERSETIGVKLLTSQRP